MSDSEVRRTPPIVMSEEFVWAMDFFLRLTQLEEIYDVQIKTAQKSSKENKVDVLIVSEGDISNVVEARSKLTQWLRHYISENLIEVAPEILEFLMWHRRGQEMVLSREEAWDCILPLHSSI